MLSSIQTSMANKTTATNPTTVQTPNTPITPTPVSRPQTNLDFKKAQTSTPVVQNTPLQSSITTNNPAYQFWQLKASSTNEVANTAWSRFIGFQTPQVAQNTSIWTGQEAKSFNKLKNEEYMLINSNATNAEWLNKKEEERYRTLSEAIIDFEANVLKNNGRMSEWEMKTKFPEFADNIDSLKELQNEIRPIIQEWYWVEPDQIAQYYPELLNPKKTYNIEATKKKSAENQKAYENVKKTIDKALTLNVEWLSSNWLKIARDFDTIFSIVDLVKNKYSVWDANDSEIFEYLIKNNEKVRGLYDEIKSLEPSLTETDKSILNRKDANLLNEVITEGITKIIDLGGKGLENLGLEWNTKATDDEIETAIRAKEKLEEGFKDQTWKKLAVEINVPLDSLEKFAYRTYKDMYNKILKEGSEYTKEKITKTIKSAFKKELGVDLTDEQVESIENLYETAVTPSINQEIQTNQQNVMDYLESVNKEYQNKKGTLDEDIENYTNNMSMTKALLNRDWRGFGYKSTWEAAQNAEMPLMVLAGTVAPEIVLPLMSMDSYARESQESFEELMEVQEKMWIPKEQAYENAQEGSAIVWVTSALVEVWLEKVLWWVETTASTAFHDLIMKDVAEKTTKMVAERGLVDLLKKWMVTQFRSSFEEWMEEIVQQWIHNKAIQKYDPDHKLTEWLLESFEWGFFNWMNLLWWGWDILNSIKQNKDTLTQNANQTAYNLWEKTRNIVDRFRDDWWTPPPAWPAAQRQNVLQNVNNKVTTQENQTNNVNQTTAITPVNNNIQNQNEEAIELKDDDTATQKKNTAIKEWWITEKVMEQLNWLDENTRERIKKNPYSIEESKNLIQEMDENPWIDFGDYQNSRYEEVLNEILDKLEQKEDKRKNDIGKLYDKLEEANVEVDVSWLKNKISEFQARAEALEDIMTPAEQAQVKTILKNIQEIWNWTMDVWKARRIADKRTKGSANSTYDWIGLIRDIRDSIDEIIREQNPDMKEVDKSYHQILKEIWDLRGNIVYKKWGQVKGNAVSTVKNMLNASNRLYLNKLEQYLPWIKDKLEAIRDSKFVYNAYTTWKGSRFISGIARGIFSNIWKAIWFFAGWWWGLLAWAVVDAWTDKAMINLTRTALRDTITKETAKSKAELERINQKIEEWKKLDAEDKARLKELGEKIMQNAEQMAKERGKQAEWDKFVQDLEANETPQTTDEEQEKNKVTKKKPAKKNKVTEKKAETKKSDNQKKAVTSDNNPEGLSLEWQPITDNITKKSEKAIENEMMNELEQNETPQTVEDEENKVNLDDIKSISDLENLLTKKTVQDHPVYEWYINWKYYEIAEFVWEYQIVEWNNPEDINHAKNWVAIGWQYVSTINWLKAFIEWKSNLEVIEADRWEKNKVTAKKVEESKPKNLVTAKIEENNNTEQSEFEVLPDDVSIEKEAKEAWPKRIAPDRIPRQQLTYEDWVKKLQEQVKTVAEYIKASDDLRAAMYGEYKGEKSHNELTENYKELGRKAAQILWKDWQFKSDKSKEFKDLWKNIRDNLNNEKGLNEIWKTFYISKVKKDISRGYMFPQEVLKDIPWAKKAIDSRERYQKGLDTSFSSKDNRIDYSEKDKIWAWIKSQDWKQVTKEQKENIVKWVMDFQKVFSIDMKRIAEELWFVYVDLHWGNVFLSDAAGMYRREYNKDWTVKNSSVSVWGSETVRFKDKKTWEWKSEKVNTTMSHELGHVVDRLVEWNLIRGYTLSDLRRTFQHRSSPNSIFQYWPNSSFVRNYLSKDTEIVARAFGQYMDMAKWWNNYIRSDWEWKLGYWSKSDFETIVKPTLEKAIKEKLWDWYINPDDVKYQRNVVSNGKNKITAKTQQVVQQANKVTEKEISDLSNQLKKTGLAKDVVVVDSEKDFFNIINWTTDQARLQSVWHGSKANFNRFDSNHIGEWEGAQSHWWGHYVGVDKGLIKKYYTDVLWSDYNYNWLDYRAEGERGKLGVRDRDMMIDRFVREMNNWEKFNDIKKYYIKENEFKIKDAEWGLKEMERKWLNELEWYSKDELKTIKKLAKDEIELVNSLKKEDFAKGHLYEVEIPDTVKKDTPTWSNYWDENNVITDKQFWKIADVLKEKYPSQFNNPNWWYDDYLFAQFLNFRQWWFSEEMNWRQIYNMLSEILWGDKEASKFLESLWYDWIHYDWQRDWEAYVIFNDNNLEITEHIKYLKDAKWDIAWAVTPDGTVYLIRNNLRWDTLTHEFSHLLRSYAKQNNSDLFNAINKIAEEAPQELKDYVKATYWDLSADAFLDEVFAWRQGQYSGIKSAQTWYQRMWNAIKELWNKVKGKFWKEYADLDVFKAWEKKNSEELMKNVDQLLKWWKEIWQANGSDTRYQLAEWVYEWLDADYYEGRLQKQKDDLRKYADESGIRYKKKDWGYTIDDTLSELKEINWQKEWTAKEKEIKRIKRKEIIELMDIIDEWYWGEWQYKRYFDDNPDYSMTPTTIFFWKWDNMDNAISFHQPKRWKWYEFVPKWFLPIAPK